MNRIGLRAIDISIFIGILIIVDTFVMFVYHQYHQRHTVLTYEQQLDLEFDEFAYKNQERQLWGAELFCEHHPDRCKNIIEE